MSEPIADELLLVEHVRHLIAEFDDDTRSIHWSIPDPAAAGDVGDDTCPAFRATAAEIDTRIRYLCETLYTTT